ncbi:MAG: hypothetical protein WD431_15965 [Cyclobacteriaceae bacterium]
MRNNIHFTNFLKGIWLLPFLSIWAIPLYSQIKMKEPFLPEEEMCFLDEMTKDVLEQSKIYPGQFISEEFGSNQTGGTLIRPGGRDAYPSFWIRDYAMSLETGLVPVEDQRHMLLLTASTQADQSWITGGGSLVPFGTIADHIRIDNSLPIYFPGTYSYEGQGTSEWGTLPPFGDQFFFIHMAKSYIQQTGDKKILLKEINGLRMIDRLIIAFHVPPSRKENHLVYTTENFRGVDFGFRDAIKITGDLLFPSVLKYRAAQELSSLLEGTGRNESAQKYTAIAKSIKKALPEVFMDKSGLLKASTGTSNQPDVWGTALAIYFGMLDGDVLQRACHNLADAYTEGTLSYKGNIRHVLTSHDYDQDRVWEQSMAPKNRYQNGAYWGTPAGWVSYAIHQVNPGIAKELAISYIEELKENDFRKGESFGAPYECFFPDGYSQNPVYLTSVTCPLAAFRKINKAVISEP